MSPHSSNCPKAIHSSNSTHALESSYLAPTSEVSPQSAKVEVVIIGAGMAGSRLAIKLANAWQSSRHGTSEYSIQGHITLISKEAEVGYNRIMLSPVLAGETDFEETYLFDPSEYEKLGITVMAGVSVEEVDTKQQTLLLDNEQTLHYSQLVFATGSTARVIPFPNYTAKGVHVFRDLADVQALTEYAKQGKSGLVIGGGVLGLEAACALAAQGASISVVHMDGFVLNRQLDLPAAELLQEELARRGVGLEVNAHTDCINVNEAGEVTGLTLKDGRCLPADFIVMAVGVIPNIGLAKASGLAVNQGIIVDEFMQTSCDHVYAVGECVELNGELFGMVAPVNQQGDTLVSVLSQPQTHWKAFVSQPLSLKLKVSGVSAFSAGQIDLEDSEQDHIETIVYREPSRGYYQCLTLKDNKLVGAVLYGEVSEGGFYSQLINEGLDVSAIKADLIYGAAYCDLDNLANADLIDDNVTDNDTVVAASAVSSALTSSCITNAPTTTPTNANALSELA